VRKLLFLLLLVTFPITNAFCQQSITTLFATNNGNIGGIFFDIENVSGMSIVILSWDINLRDCSEPLPISVYTRSGTSQGFETSPEGWTLIGTETDVVCNPENTPTHLNVGRFIINPGDTTGIAMVIDTSSGEWAYTTGTGDNQVYNNGELEIRTGSATAFPFTESSINEPRVWNGTVFYRPLIVPVPTLSEWGLIAMAGVLGIIGLLALRRRKVTA